MSHKEILATLANDADYYGDFGKQFLSNSDIDSLINNPASFHAPSEETVDFKFGKAFHELTMFGESKHVEVVISASNRNTNKYKDAALEHGSLLLLESEYDKLMFIVEKALSNDAFIDHVVGLDAEYEVPACGRLFHDEEYEEVLWKGKADVERSDFLVDIKTTSNINLFAKSVKSYNYDSQAYIYSALFGKPLKFAAVDKKTGVVGIFDVSPFTQNDGQDKAKLAEENYIQYFRKGSLLVKNHTIYGTV